MKRNYLIFTMMMLTLLTFSACSDDEAKNSGVDIPFSPSEPITLTNISPAKGGLGTRVVITGNNFGNDKSKVKVYFNEKAALIITLNNQNIYAMVPKQPGDLSTIKVVIDGKEGVLDGRQFSYQIKAVVTTVAGTGQVGTDNGSNALEATFERVAMVDVDNEGNVLITDDWGKQIRLLSIKDNKVMTVLASTHEVWQSGFSANYENFYVIERRASQRPLIIRGLNKKSNWLEEKFYDADNLLGNVDAYGLATDDAYSIFVLAKGGQSLVKIDQRTKKMEKLGGDWGMEGWLHIAYNPVDHYLYITTENARTIYRVDPTNVPVTRDKLEIYVGDPAAGHAFQDGNGTDARFGSMEGICCDLEGNLYVADYGNHVIRKIDIHRNVTTVAGVPGQKGYKDGKPSEALFNTPYDVAVTPDGILYVADTDNNRVRCIAIQ